MEGLRVRVLGGLSVEGMAERDVGSRKGRTLLKALALARGRPVPVDRLADIVWGDELPARPADQVAVLVSRLRGVLGAERLPRRDAGYALVADWLDVDELVARVDEASAALAAGRVSAARAAADAALALARGEVLPEEDGEWVEADRAAARAACAAARRIAADAAARNGDHVTAGVLAEQAIAHDPSDEVALRILMRAHVAGGRPASALAAYARLRERLAEELGVSPSAETEQLHDAIVLGHFEDVEPGPPARPPIVGRTAELATLEAARHRATSTLILVRGEAGIGKTALVESWTASLGPAVVVLAGRCDQLGRDLPLQPIADALAGHLGELDTGDRPGTIAGDATVVVDAEAGRAALFAGLAAAVTRVAAGSEVVLVVDDAHLAARSTLAWLTYAVRRVPRLTVVAMARPAGSLAALDADVEVALGPLDVDAVAALAGSARAAEVHAQSGGQPLLVAALLAGDASVAHAVERRVIALGDAAATVRTAAVLGHHVDLDLLADVTRQPAITLLGHLEAAAAGGLLVEAGGFRFRHELERAALEESIGSTRRAFVHREAARALNARPSADPLAVAVHARLGGETALAIGAYVAAANASASRFDLPTAEEHLGAALALGDSADAFVARARVRMTTGRLDGAVEDAASAIAAGGGPRALEVAGWVAYYQRRYEDALAYADEALARAGEPMLEASCLALAGRVLHGSGDLPRAVDQLQRATALAAPADVKGVAAVWLAQARVHEGRPDDALALLSRALVDPDRLSHPIAPLHGRFVRVLALGQLGRIRDALAASDELDAAVARAGATGERFVGPAANCKAWVLRWTGRTAEADDLNASAVEATQPSGPRAEPHYAGLLDLADGRMLAGDVDGAAALLSDRLSPIEDWQGTMGWHQRHRWNLLRARLSLAAGDRDTAAALAHDVEADALARGARRYALIARAVGAMAGDGASRDPAALEDVVAGLASCAAIDGWPLVAALGRACSVDAWVTEAGRRATALVAVSPHADATRRLADRLLS